MSDKPNRKHGEKTLGQMGLAISNAERREIRESKRNSKAARIARNRSLKKAKGK